jgi:biotin operon repressor
MKEVSRDMIAKAMAELNDEGVFSEDQLALLRRLVNKISLAMEIESDDDRYPC